MGRITGASRLDHGRAEHWSNLQRQQPSIQLKSEEVSMQTIIRTSFLVLAAGLLAACSVQSETEPTAPAAPDALSEGAGAPGVRTSWPSDQDPGVPFYARIEPAPPHVPMDGAWAAVVFYRDPACIPADFNLVQFFDAPAAFACPVVMQGSSLWASGFGVGSPRVTNQTGNAVPIWFVPADKMIAALADGHVTIGEIAAIAGRLTGIANQFKEVVHPHPLPPAMGGGGHPNPGIVLSAQGSLEDGRTFQLQHNQGDTGRNMTRISFR
jgi:hypothetical protein